MKQHLTSALTAVTTILVTLLLVSGPAQAHRAAPLPVMEHPIADPSVVAYATGFLALSTGARAPGAVAASPYGQWRSTGPLLRNLPGWVGHGSIWAADTAHIGRRWVMYYAAPVRHLAHNARCIGVAVSSDPTRGFDASGRAPLVCPAGARAKRADDQLRGRGRALPRAGVIDPSYFRRGRASYLLYRTQRTPATIRIVRLRHHGLRAAHHSRQVLRTRDITENPVVVRHGHRYVLFTSQGYYGSCGYRTSWRSSRSLFHFPSHGHRLLTGRRSRICGPGGLDVVGRLVFFHGWVCRGERRCSSGPHLEQRSGARRTMYAGRLGWRHGHPHVQLLRG